jgi:hypothetical protein
MALNLATSERAKHKATPTIIDSPLQKQPHPCRKPQPTTATNRPRWQPQPRALNPATFEHAKQSPSHNHRPTKAKQPQPQIRKTHELNQKNLKPITHGHHRRWRRRRV